MPLHQHVGSGETMHRDGVGFEYAHDLAKDQCMVADVLHHLITEAELEMTNSIRPCTAIVGSRAPAGRSSCPNNRRAATNRRRQPRERHSPCSIIFRPLGRCRTQSQERARAGLQRFSEPFEKAQVSIDRSALLLASHYGFSLVKTLRVHSTGDELDDP